jgi:hypothetical protein
VKLAASLIAVLLLIAPPSTAADAVQIALQSLSDPAKIATLQSDRAANPRIRKIAYWLEVARQDGREPESEMATALNAHGWSGTLKAQLTAASMARNRTIAERLGCLDAEGMELLRRGKAPTITRGPYAGEKLTVDHIIPRAVAPTLDKVLANLELMPHSLNIRKGAKVGQRQIDLANKLLAAGLLTPEDNAAILARQMPGYDSE